MAKKRPPKPKKRATRLTLKQKLSRMTRRFYKLSAELRAREAAYVAVQRDRGKLEGKVRRLERDLDYAQSKLDPIPGFVPPAWDQPPGDPVIVLRFEATEPTPNGDDLPPAHEEA
jgi:hypothetical protein